MPGDFSRLELAWAVGPTALCARATLVGHMELVQVQGSPKALHVEAALAGNLKLKWVQAEGSWSSPMQSASWQDS